MPEGSGPQKMEDVVREFLEQHYSRLVRHARRHILQDELAGDIPKDALDAREIADEVARQAIANAGRKPREMTWLVWIYRLMHEELRRQHELHGALGSGLFIVQLICCQLEHSGNRHRRTSADYVNCIMNRRDPYPHASLQPGRSCSVRNTQKGHALGPERCSVRARNTLRAIRLG
jgi:hypothetical protein